MVMKKKKKEEEEEEEEEEEDFIVQGRKLEVTHPTTWHESTGATRANRGKHGQAWSNRVQHVAKVHTMQTQMSRYA